MKKLATLLLAFFSLFCTFALISCRKGENTHHHSYIGYIRYDADGHWEECACGEIFNYSGHSGEQTGIDEDSHYFICNVCEQAFNIAPHEGATVDYDGTHHFNICDDCGAKYNCLEHNGDSLSYLYDDEQHWYQCQDCGVKINLNEHDYRLSHTTNHLSEDSEYHWWQCHCGKKKEEPPQLHTYEIKKSDTAHWEECTICGLRKPFSWAEHIYEWKINDEQHWEECICGVETERITHSYDSAVQYDNNVHWWECGCGARKEVAHEYQTKKNDTHHWLRCDCGAETEKVAHTFEERLCSCGYQCLYSLGLEYTLSRDERYYIVSGIGTATDTDIVIPAIYKELPVQMIGEEAFSWCDRLTSITIPDSVTSIENNAFSYCHGLMYVDIGDGVTSIGDSAFESCEDLTRVIIPQSVKTIGKNAFDNCYHLAEVTIPNGVERIGDRAFSASALTKVVIPESVYYLGDGYYGLFNYCDKLTSIEVDEKNPNYKSIDGNLYEKMADGSLGLLQYALGKKASQFSIPNEVSGIVSHAFWGSSYLKSVNIPSSVTSICTETFDNNITNISFEIIDGWRVSQNSWEWDEANIVNPYDLADSASAAKCLNDTYLYYYWKRDSE